MSWFFNYLKKLPSINADEITSSNLKRSHFILVTNEYGTIVGVIHPQTSSLVEEITFYNSDCTIWKAYEILKEKDCNYLVILEKENPRGVIEKTKISR